MFPLRPVPLLVSAIAIETSYMCFQILMVHGASARYNHPLPRCGRVFVQNSTLFPALFMRWRVNESKLAMLMDLFFNLLFICHCHYNHCLHEIYQFGLELDQV